MTVTFIGGIADGREGDDPWQPILTMPKEYPDSLEEAREMNYMRQTVYIPVGMTVNEAIADRMARRGISR